MVFGLFKRTGGNDTASILSTQTAPPSYAPRGLKSTHTSKRGDSLPGHVHRFKSSLQPFAETVVFDSPWYDYKKDKLTDEAFKDKSPQVDKAVKVTLSIPKVSHSLASSQSGSSKGTPSAAYPKEPTMDMCVHLECTADHFQELLVECTYKPYHIIPPEKQDHTNETVVKPWVVTAVPLKTTNGQSVSHDSVYFMASGRFTDTGLWSIKRGTQPIEKRPSLERTLSGAPLAICATSAYTGPCLVYFRIGVKHARYSNGKAIDNLAEREMTYWKSLATPVLFEGGEADFVKGYLHAVGPRKLLE